MDSGLGLVFRRRLLPHTVHFFHDVRLPAFVSDFRATSPQGLWGQPDGCLTRFVFRRNPSSVFRALPQSMGPNVATPELFAEALFTDTSSWTVIDRGPFEALLPITVSFEEKSTPCLGAAKSSAGEGGTSRSPPTHPPEVLDSCLSAMAESLSS